MRFSIVENDSGIEVNEIFPDYSIMEVEKVLYRLNNRIKKELGIKRDAIALHGTRLQAMGIAGILRVSSSIELLIIPKYISGHGKRWQESLFLLSALSRYGDLITENRVASDTKKDSSLFDMAGRILEYEYQMNKRQPLRQYRQYRYVDYSIDGEIDFELAFDRNPDGVLQERVLFDKQNSYNATIQEAMRLVVPYICDSGIKERLLIYARELGKQKFRKGPRERVPARNRCWSNIYNLSFDILSGMGSITDVGVYSSPGFIANTWRIWEWLITFGLKYGMGKEYEVVPQAKISWGTSKSCSEIKKVNVFPDVLVYKNGMPEFIVDAKYKTLKNGMKDIDREDLYEAFAFCDATNVNNLFLAYPKEGSAMDVSADTSLVGHINISGRKIIIIRVSVGLINKQIDLDIFAKRLCNSILSYL